MDEAMGEMDRVRHTRTPLENYHQQETETGKQETDENRDRQNGCNIFGDIWRGFLFALH